MDIFSRSKRYSFPFFDTATCFFVLFVLITACTTPPLTAPYHMTAAQPAEIEKTEIEAPVLPPQEEEIESVLPPVSFYEDDAPAEDLFVPIEREPEPELVAVDTKEPDILDANNNLTEEIINETAEPERGYQEEDNSEYYRTIPVIQNFENGKYYIQIASYTEIEKALSETDVISGELPVAVMKTNVAIRGKDTQVFRVLIGPLDSYSDSYALLQQCKTAYNDAFIWYEK